MNGDQISLHVGAREGGESIPLEAGIVPYRVIEPSEPLTNLLRDMGVEYQKIRVRTKKILAVLNVLRVVAGIMRGPHQVIIQNV
jgi:hypothetical protein